VGTPQTIRERYERDESALRSLDSYVNTTLRPWCSGRGYVLEHRVKSVGSVGEKLETGRFGRWSELDDLVAFTIVVPTASHESTVLAKLRAVFEEIGVRGRGTAQKAPEVFRFDATRWYGRVRQGGGTPQLEARALEIVFEVQIKTAFEHAWSTVTHDIVFKGQQVDWRSKRLAAQLKALVEQIDFLVNQFESAAAAIEPSTDPATDTQALIAATCMELIDDDSLPPSLCPESWQRFGEAVFALMRGQTRNNYEAATKGRNLVEEFARAIRSGDLVAANSGSLFQCVVAFLVGRDGVVSIEGFPLAESTELVDLYGVAEIPLKLDLEA
jgi:hypothetical protein